MLRRGRLTLSIGVLVSIFSAGLLGSCMPSSMKVRSGLEPRNQDDNVRFRATYYFRVFDTCQVNEKYPPKGNFITTDALYRFRMTGKSNELFNKVVFESGMLKSYEIDPFGANISYDKTNKRFFFKSRRQTEREAACAERDAELKRLNGVYDELDKKDTMDEVRTSLAKRMAAVAGDKSCTLGNGQSQPAAGNQVSREQALSDAGDELIAVGDTIKTITIGSTFKSKIAELTDFGNELDKAGRALRAIRAKNEDTAGQLKAVKSSLKTAGEKLVAAKRTDNKDAKFDTAASLIVDAGKNMAKAGDSPLHFHFFMTEAARQMDQAADALTKAAANNENTAKSGNPEISDAKILEAIASNLRSAGLHLRAAARPEMSAGVCPAGVPTKRGFQILGPEGWRTFDQDERLIMAMYSNAKPLIRMLKNVSARFLNEQPGEGSSLLSLAKSRLAVSNALRELNDVYGPKDNSKITKDNVSDSDDDKENSINAISDVAKTGMAP